MINLESTRAGWVFRSLGALFILGAIGITAWNIESGHASVAFINLVTFACGIWNIHLGGRQVRSAREHHQFMEDHRARMTRLTAWRNGGAS